jgi:hypothetical protein
MKCRKYAATRVKHRALEEWDNSVASDMSLIDIKLVDEKYSCSGYILMSCSGYLEMSCF